MTPVLSVQRRPRFRVGQQVRVRVPAGRARVGDTYLVVTVTDFQPVSTEQARSLMDTELIDGDLHLYELGDCTGRTEMLPFCSTELFAVLDTYVPAPALVGERL